VQRATVGSVGMKLSVIIPVCNAAPYLRECLSSVCLPDVEVIAVDDGSTDASGEILDQFSAERSDARVSEHPGIRVLHQPNAGVGSARNVGLAAAHGDWCLFVDADDVLAEGWQDVLADMALRCPDADLLRFSRTESLPLRSARPGPVRRIDLSQVIGREQFDDCFCQYAYRREMIRDLRYPALVLGEDKVFQASVLSRAQVCMRSDAVLYGYRQHAGSAVHQQWDERRFDSEASWRCLWLKTLLGSGKRMSGGCLRQIGLVAIEYHPYRLRQVANVTLRHALEERWFASLRELSRFPFAPYQSFVLRLLSVSKNRALVTVFCQIPFVLKQFFRQKKKKAMR